MKETISIILPVYNAEKTIDRCIYSIISQTYEKIQLIVINDASNDGSANIINKYLKKDKRIVLIQNDENYGVSKSRNLGIEKATGEFITFIDSDDYYEENAIEQMHKLIIENHDAVRFSFNRIDENKKYITKYNKKYAEKNFNNKEKKMFILDLLNNNMQAYLWLLITKTEIAKKIKFDENIGMMEDTLWYLNFVKQIQTIYFSNNILYNYVINKESASNSEKKVIKRIEDVLYLQNEYEKMFKEKQDIVQAYTGLLGVIIENLFKLENSKLSNESKIEFYVNIKNKESYQTIIKHADYRLIRKDRKFIVKLLNKNRFKLLEYYCKLKAKLKNGFKILKKIIEKIQRRLLLYKNKLASEIYYNKNRAIFKQYTILDDSVIIEKIINDNCSLARFGDGEFKWILGVKQKSFQSEDIELSHKLKECLQSNLENLIIGIPKPLQNLKNYNNFAKKTWKLYIHLYGKMISNLILNNGKYADTNITRFYMDYKNKENCKQKIENMKKIWNDKDIVIIEGEKTKLGVGNDLFCNVKSLKRILAPSENAFNKYEEILEVAKKQNNNVMFLISLGPTATVLTYELAKVGYQAIDLGHIDVEYEWYLRKAKNKIPIKGKYVNEAKGIGDLSDINIIDKSYNKSILEIIK